MTKAHPNLRPTERGNESWTAYDSISSLGVQTLQNRYVVERDWLLLAELCGISYPQVEDIFEEHAMFSLPGSDSHVQNPPASFAESLQ